MAERWVVLGGWGFDPAILRPVFGPEALLCDINLLMPEIVTGKRLNESWEERAAKWLEPLVPSRPFCLAGWSTGAMVAWAVAPKLRPTRLILLSATPSFCRTSAFPFGTRPALLERMRESLLLDPDSVLASFAARCGIALPGGRREEHTSETLAAGLTFLRLAGLLPAEPLPFPVQFFHGTNDCIIPAEAGRAFAAMVSAQYTAVPGGHGFFLDNPIVLGQRLSRGSGAPGPIR